MDGIPGGLETLGDRGLWGTGGWGILGGEGRDDPSLSERVTPSPASARICVVKDYKILWQCSRNTDAMNSLAVLLISLLLLLVVPCISI